jgi:hypothetical protein
MMIRLALAVVVLTPLAACRGRDRVASRDPCTLLSAAEAEPYVGPVATPPYRTSDGAADERGDECMYRGKDGGQVTVRPAWSGGRFMGRVLQDVPNALGGVLGKGGAAGLDTLTHRVMQQGPAGPWDRATWIPGGSLFASKGEAEVSIDVSGASGREADALALAKIVVPRFGHPLDYDGAKAVALAPKPRPHPANACDLVPRSEVEAAIGPLDGAPASDSSQTSCTYRVATAQGERSYPVALVWQGGQKNYRMLTHGMATISGMLGTPASSPLDSMKPPPEMQAAIGGLMNMVAGGSAGGGPGSAPGAAATVGFRTDTTLKGPWDNAALLHGTQFVAVRHDAFVGMSLVSADYDKAKALLGAICARL